MSESALDKAGDKLQETADRWAAEGGLKAKAAPTLADDAEFIRKLKPSLIAARARGDAPTDERPGQGHLAPSGPQIRRRPSTSGPNPWLVAGLALAVGIALAKLIDWRGHAHPRD